MSEKQPPVLVKATFTVPVKYRGQSYAAGDTIEVTVAEQLAMSCVLKTDAQIHREKAAQAQAEAAAKAQAAAVAKASGKTKPSTKTKE